MFRGIISFGLLCGLAAFGCATEALGQKSVTIEGFAVEGYADGIRISYEWVPTRAEAETVRDEMLMVEDLKGKYYDLVDIVPETRTKIPPEKAPKKPEGAMPEPAEARPGENAQDRPTPGDGPYSSNALDGDTLTMWLEEFDMKTQKWNRVPGRVLRLPFEMKEVFRDKVKRGRELIKNYNDQLVGQPQYRVQSIPEVAVIEFQQIKPVDIPPAYNPPQLDTKPVEGADRGLRAESAKVSPIPAIVPQASIPSSQPVSPTEKPSMPEKFFWVEKRALLRNGAWTTWTTGVFHSNTVGWLKQKGHKGSFGGPYRFAFEADVVILHDKTECLKQEIQQGRSGKPVYRETLKREWRVVER